LHAAPNGVDETTLVRLASRPAEQLQLPADAHWLSPRGAARIAITAAQRDALYARIEQALADFHRDSPDEPGPEATRLRRIALPTASLGLWQALVEGLVQE